MSEVSVKRVEVSGDLVTTEQVTDCNGRVFTPDSIDWWGMVVPSGAVIAGVVLYGGEESHRTNVTLWADDELPAWVPEPPISWEQMRGMVQPQAVSA